MFCFGALRQAGSIAKCLCGCLFCLLCGGPILLIVGIVILTAPNTRADDVKEYNTVVGAYDHLESDAWAPGNIGGATTTLVTEQIMIKGDDEGIDKSASRFARAYVSSQPTTVSYTISTILPFSRTPSYTQQRTSVGQCRFDTCLYGNGVVCPTTSTWSGPNRCEQGNCGTCTYSVYLSKYCVAVKKNDVGSSPTATWSLDTTTTCFYNSDSILVNTNPSTVEFQVRQKGDPFIALQRITKGSEDFGITSGQQTVTGLTLIIIGAVMIAGMCAVAFIVYKLVKKFIVKDDEDNNGGAEMGNYGGSGGGNNNNNNAPTFTPTNQYYKPQHASSAPSSHLPSSRQQQQQGSSNSNNTAVQGHPLGYQQQQSHQPAHAPPPPPGTPSYFGSVPGTAYHPHAISPRPPGQV